MRTLNELLMVKTKMFQMEISTYIADETGTGDSVLFDISKVRFEFLKKTGVFILLRLF